jgi:hypothetical protein
MQAVNGVDWVDVDLLDGIAESDASDPDALAAQLEALAGASPKQRVLARLARLDTTTGRVRPAQLAYLNPELPDTLLLSEVTA